MESTEERNRAKVGKLAGIVGIICNFALAGGKFVVGTLVSSMSIIADSVNNYLCTYCNGCGITDKVADRWNYGCFGVTIYFV